VDDREDTSGESSVGKELSDHELGSRRVLRRLENGAVSCHESARDSSLSENERCVPRRLYGVQMGPTWREEWD
jgi:hypothetical protein